MTRKLMTAAVTAAMTLALAVAANAADYTISVGHINAENDS